METLTVTPFPFTMKPTHKPYTMPSHRATAPHMTMPASPVAQRPALDMGSPKLSIHNAARSELLCRYPSKVCDNLRSEKRGGGLHRFCAFHRERANINQRRVDHRRRLRRRGGMVSPIERPQDKDAHSSDEDNNEEMLSLDVDSFGFDEPLCSALSEDDLRVLIALLDDSTTSDDALMPSIKQEPTREW